MDTFKVPQNIPQDLLLIHDIVGVSSPPLPLANFRSSPKVTSDDDIESSDSETASEDEIEATLTSIANEGGTSGPNSDSSSSTDPESGSDSEESNPKEKDDDLPETDIDEEEDVPNQSRPQTQNEVPEVAIVTPDITEVGQDEILEKVGEIVNVMGNTVIIRGTPSDVVGRASDRALDSETLLVFNDRKVLGYVYETFGPTSQPLYQVKFNKDFPLDPSQVTVSREVFHVPIRSNFVFLRSLQSQKGSDASNVHDEEPGEHELEFSDDEAEAAHKAALKKRRHFNSQSATSSRQSTPTPSQMHDQDMMEIQQLSRNPYDERGFYDDPSKAGPSRPPPMPYDDPYSDSYTSMKPDPISNQGPDFQPKFVSRGRGRRDPGRRGRRGHSGHSGPYVPHKQSKGNSDLLLGNQPSYLQNAGSGQSIPRPLSPTSLAIARATGQVSNFLDPSLQHSPGPSLGPATVPGNWGYADPQHGSMFHFGAAGYPQAFIQPHINPRFANALGINIGLSPYHSQPMPPYSPHDNTQLPWPTSSAASAGQTEQWSAQTRSGAAAKNSNSRSPAM